MHYIILVLVGGLLLGFSYPFTGGHFVLSFVALVPLLIVNFQIDKLTKGRWWKRFLANYFYFLLFNFIATWWIYNASPAGMYMAVFTNSLLMTFPMLFTGFISRHIGENRGLLAFMMLWLAFEYSHYYGELSWPWLNFGHIYGDAPSLIQWYEYSGVLGGTLWMLTVNVFIYIVVRNVVFREESWKVQVPNFVVLGFSIIFPITFSLITYYNYKEKVDPVEVVVVQPNIDPWGEKFDVPMQQQIGMMLSLASTEVSENTDLIVFPETAIPYPLIEDGLDSTQFIKEMQDVLKKLYDTPLLCGASTYKMFDHENSPATYQIAGRWMENYNSSLLIHPYNPLQIYHKAKPVLGGEKVPFISWFPFLKEYSVELGGTSGVIGPGSEIKNLEASGLQFTPLICYESVYGEFVSNFVSNGADIICIITNDGWYKDTPGHKQHMMFARIRAIENRRSVARSANTGISCLINQRGDVIKRLDWEKRGVLTAELNRNEEVTFYMQYGDLFGRLGAFLAIGLFIFAITQMVKKRGVKTGT